MVEEFQRGLQSKETLTKLSSTSSKYSHSFFVYRSAIQTFSLMAFFFLFTSCSTPNQNLPYNVTVNKVLYRTGTYNYGCLLQRQLTDMQINSDLILDNQNYF